MNANDKAKQIIKENLYMTIATSSKSGKPWISNLFFACDDNFNFYWYSVKTSIHSGYIKENPDIAISIFNSTVVGDDVDGLYIKAQAFEVTSITELISGLKVTGAKLLENKLMIMDKDHLSKYISDTADFLGNGKLRLYKAIPEICYKLEYDGNINGKYTDKRVEVSLNK